MKKLFGIACVLFCFLNFSIAAYAETAVDTSAVDALLAEIDAQYEEYFGWNYFSNLWQGNADVNMADIVTAILELIRGEHRLNFSFLGKLLFLAILSAILGTLEEAFGESIGKMARLVVFFLAVLLVIEETKYLWSVANKAGEDLIAIMDALLPIQLVLMLAAGGAATAGVLQPLYFWSINVIGNLAKNMLLPGIFFCLILAIVNAMSEKYRLEKLQKLLKKVILSVFGGINSLFLLIITLSGTSAAVGDSFGLRSLRYLAGNFIPVVGSFAADTAQMAAGGAIFLKNGVGFIGMFVIIWVAFLPGIKILLAGWGMKLVAALIEPLGEKMLCEMFQNVGECVILLFWAVALMGLVFFLSMVILTALAQMIFMLR